MKKILIGTHNNGKFKELSYLISSKIKKISPKKLNIKSPKETGKTFSSNAILKAKYFSKFYSSEYNPLISTFHVQNEIKIGGYPIIDFFLNAKIRQTRLFFIFEHINSSLTGNKYFSTPTNPYRDTSFRFGLNWNLFN